MAKDRAAGIDVRNFSHHPWTKPDPLVHLFILVPRPAISGSGGVESH